MRIVTISVPTPFYVGPVNCYLIAEDPLTLIDTGPKTKEAADALREGLRRAGFRVADLRRIVLTHTHEDHCGLAKSLRDEAKNAEILVHDWETGHRVNRLADAAQQQLLVRAGVPVDEIATLRRMYEMVNEWGDALADDEHRAIVDNEELLFERGALRVIHTPGHTPGSCSFLREADRTIFAGDCLLKRITPNPVLAPDPLDPTRRFRSLAEYLVSLARLRELAPTLVYGGHGEQITDYEELFNRYWRAVKDRQAAVLRLIPQNGLTAWELAQQLFPGTDDVHRFLAISEAVAHLDYAEHENRLRVEWREGVEIYRSPR